MKSYLQSLAARLKVAAPELKTVELDCGQFEQEQPAVKFPAALVNLSATDVSHVKPNLMNCHATLTVTVADMRFSGVQRDPTVAFNFADTVEALATKLNDWTDGRFGRLHLTGISQLQSNPGFVVYQLTFSTSFGLEPSAEPEPTTTEPTTTEPGEPTTTEPGGEPAEPTEPSAEPTTTEPDFEDGPVF